MPFVMPAEWEPHAATWLAWPHQHSDWPGKFGPIPWVYGEIVRHLSRYERVDVIVLDTATRDRARKVLSTVGADSANVRYHVAATNRSWVRDSGPIFVRDGSGVTALDWRFTAWANYDDWHTDDKLAAVVAKAAKVTAVKPRLGGQRVVLEGGGIDVNGAGLLLTTEEWLLSEKQVRNPGFTRAEYEALFAEYLGVRETVWLGRGIVGDDTHGHIDDIARFVAPRRVAACIEANPADENYALLQDNLARLKAAKLDVAALPMPAPLVFRGQRLPASYANFYIGNGVVLVPTFNDRNDRVALGVLADLFPGRDVIGIHCVDLVWGLGTLHCLTQQQPA